MGKDIAEVEFVVFDTETTGLEHNFGDKIVEIAAIRLQGKKRLSEFHSLVNPRRPISEAAQKVNQISEEMLKDAPSIDMVMPRFLDFISGGCLCSYNACFDIGFLASELKSLGQELPDILAIDILKMSRRLLPGLNRYPLWFVAQSLGIEAQQRHRALADVELTLEVFNRLNEILKVKRISDFESLISLFGYSLKSVAVVCGKKSVLPG